MHRSISAKLFAATLFGLSAAAGAQTIAWNAAASGTFSVGANWVGGVAPTSLNNANFGVVGSYTVTFISPASNTSLGVSLGNVTFSGAQLYSLGNLATINGGSLTLNGTDISSAAMSVNGNSRLTINATSEWSATDINVGNLSANNGTILVNGGTLSSSTALSLGLNGGDGTVSLTSGTTASFNQINLANSGISGSGGTLLVANTSVITATGPINIGNGGVASQVGLLRQSDSTNFTQTGAVGMTISAAANSVGTLDLVSGTFTTGTGIIAVNPTGTLRVGSGGVFNANGNMNITGGVFDFFNGTVNFAANQTVTLNNGAVVSPTLGGTLSINAGRTWNVTGSSVAAAGNFNVDIGTSGNGSMIVNAGTIQATGFGVLNMGATGTTGTLSLLNGSLGDFNSLNSTAGAARITVSGGSTLSFNNLINVTGAGPSSIALNTGGVMSGTRLVLNNGTLTLADAASRVSVGSLDLQSAGRISVSGGALAVNGAIGTSFINGTITLTGGSLTVSNDLVISGGDIIATSPGSLSTFVRAVQLDSAGVISVPTFSSLGTLNVIGGSTISANDVRLNGPQTIINNGSDVIALSSLEVGFNNTAATVNTSVRQTSTVTVSGSTVIGSNAVATLLFADQSSGTFNSAVSIGNNPFASNSAGTLVVQDEADVNLFGNLNIANQQTSNNTGNVIVSGGGELTLNGPASGLTLGTASLAAGTLTVKDGGKFVMNPAGIVSLGTTGKIVVNGGDARLGTFSFDPFGQIVFTSGTLGTNGVLNVANTGVLGSSLILNADRALFHGGTFTINGGTVAINGGTLTAGTFGISTASLSFQSGYLGVTGSAGATIGTNQMLGSNVNLTSGKTLAITNALTIANGAQLTLDGGTLQAGSVVANGRLLAMSGQASIGTLSIPTTGRVIIDQNMALDPATTSNSGRIELGGGLARLGGNISNSAGAVISGDGELAGTLTNAGELRADVTQTLLVSGTFASNTGRLTANGGRIEVLSNLSNSGSIDLTDGVFHATAGMTNAASGRITGRGTLRSNGAVNNLGTVTFSSGTSDVNAPTFTNSGRTIVTGTSVTTFFGAVSNSGGSELRVSTGATAVFLGDVTGASFITGGGAKIFEAGASGLLSTPGDSIVEAFGSLSLQHIRERALTINGGVVQIQSGGTAAGVSRLNELNISGTPSNWDGQFDLSNNALIVDYATISPKAAVIDYLKTGFANGAWNGQGISSSTAALQPNRAIGIAEASDIGSPSIFLGQSVDSTSLLLRFTLPGDANLDGTVNITDFALLASNFNTPTYWAKGDFNYNGLTNINDFALLASNFNQSLPIDLPRSTVPEPVGLSLLSITLLGRRQRNRNHR